MHQSSHNCVAWPPPGSPHNHVVVAIVPTLPAEGRSTHTHHLPCAHPKPTPTCMSISTSISIMFITRA